MSGHDEFRCAQAALQFGAQDYLLRPASAAELGAAMSRVAVRLWAKVRG